MEWSPNEDKVIYIAEKKARKTEPFYKQKAKDESKNNENKEGNISLVISLKLSLFII